MNFETIVGIEIHVEMKTKSKMFSLAPINFGAAPNSQVNLRVFIYKKSGTKNIREISLIFFTSI